MLTLSIFFQKKSGKVNIYKVDRQSSLMNLPIYEFLKFMNSQFLKFHRFDSLMKCVNLMLNNDGNDGKSAFPSPQTLILEHDNRVTPR